MNDAQKPKRQTFAAFPAAWTSLATRGLAWFVTHIVYELPDGRAYHWESRRHRKGRGGVVESADRKIPARPRRALRLWGCDVKSLTWWIAIIFTIGSAFLIVGALGPLMPNRVAHAVTFSFLGSTCFTIANYLSLLEIINADRNLQRDVEHLDPKRTAESDGDHSASQSSEPPRFRWWTWMPQELAFVATFTMFAGGLLFKACYAFGVLKWLNWVEVDILINMPGLIGSVCFLVASYLYIVEVVHKPWGIQIRSIAWWSAFTCLLGSIGYTVSGVYGFFGEGPILIEQTWGNYAAVFAGAVFFFVSSYLMIPEALDHPDDDA